MGEDVDSFIENFDLAAIINNWNETEKITLLPLYLKDSASKFFKLIKTKTPNINWEQTKQQIKEKFTNIGNDKLLRIQLNQRNLMENETLNEFIINMMELCYKINPNMMEEEICEKILAGLPDEIYNKIEILDNTNITKITENLKRYELAKMVRKTDEKQNSNVDKLNEEINILKKHIQQLTTDIREKPLQNHTTNYTNGTNNNSEIYNQQFPSQYCPPYFNPNQQNSNLTYNQISQNIPNTFTQQQNQYQNYQHWNPPRPIPTCYGCGKVGHIKRNCYNQKKLKVLQAPGSVKGIFSKTRNNDSITNEINHVIYSCYKINEQKHKIEILGKVNEEPTLLLLDTGASVTVIDKKVTLLENIKPINDMYLKTANDSKLNILGSTIIKIQIASLIIRHQAVVVDNLCSPILLGLDFMTKTQIVMNLKDNLILIRYENQEVKLPIETQELNNNIQGTQVHCFSHEILNEYQQFLLLSNNSEHFNHTSRYEEITGDLFSDQSSDAIAHCVSECLTMNRGIALQFRKKFNNIDNLISQKKRVREIAAIKTEKQWVLYLITKNHYYEKPTYVNIFVTLQNLRTFCLEQQIKRVALPKICAGQDGKEWPIISNMLKFIFRNTCITISIYDINKSILKNNEITDKINNNGMGFFFADNIDHTLRENILLDASYLNKIKEVPSDGDCGAHALRVCLRGEGLEVSTIEILRKINIPNTKSGYQMTEDDLAYLADHFNKNLTIISKHKNTDNNQLNTAIIYWKKNRPTIGVIHENNHWNPALINRESSPLTLHNAYIYTVIPDINTITKHINRYLDECHDRLNVSSFNEKNYSLDKYNINNPIEIKNNDVIKTPIMWYTQFCQDCEHLSTSESALKSHEYLNHPYWTEGGEVMFCDICGTYIREYRNIVMNENEKNLVDRHKKTKFHHTNSLKLANRKNDNERLNYNNVPYIDKQNIDELEFDINPKLTQSQQTQLKIILNTYTDCFAKHSMELGAIDVGDVPIPTITTEPVNLPPYRLALTEQQELQRQINELLKFGLITPSISSYASPAFLVNKADVLLDKINDERETLQQYLNIDKKYNVNSNGYRTKRSSFFGGIGKLQRGLFGVLTEEEGEEYQNKIRLLEEKQLKTLLIQKDQTKIFESTLDSVTKISSDFTKIKDNLNNYINKINYEISNQKEELKILNIKEYIMLYNSVYSELINQYSKDTSILLNTVIIAHRGQINPQILKPNELLDHFKDAKANLPSNLNMPMEINIKNYFDFMKIIELNICYQNHLIIYSINVPLIENLNFNLYRIISLPVHVNKNNFIFIQSPEEYLVVENNKQYYTFLSQDQVDKCKSIKTNTICSISTPLSSAIKPNCEFQMFKKGNTIPSNCEVKTITMVHDIWHHLKNNNQWLYATPEPIEIVISCGEEAENTIINQTGLLSLKTNCRAFTKNTLIISKYKNQSNFSKDYLPPFHLPNFTENLNNIIMKQKVPYDNVDTIEIPRKFNDLKVHAKSLSILNQEMENLLTNNIKEKTANIHSIVITTLTIIIIVAILYKIIKYIRNINKKANSKTDDKLKIVYQVDKNKLQNDNNITAEEVI
ncbi:hypothetical protein QTP88_011261 [Uroleucon formosanum]